MTTPCPNCKTTVSHGSQTGCCSGCGRCFSGLGAFEAHQSGHCRPGCTCAGGKLLTCLDPEASLDKDGKPRFSRSHKSKPGEPPVWKLSGGHFPQSVRSQGRDRGRVATGVPPASESGSDFDLAGWAR